MQAVQLESVSSVRVRYLIVVSTLSNKQESILLGMDFPNPDRCVCVCNQDAGVLCRKGTISIQLIISSFGVSMTFLSLSGLFPPCSDRCTIGLVLPIWSDTQVYLDGDGYASFIFLFKRGMRIQLRP